MTGRLEPAAIRCRHPRARDESGIEAMWRRSPETRYGRIHSPSATLPASYVRHVMGEPDASLLATVADSVVGLASLLDMDDGRADLGIVVEDRWQRHGIGRCLVTQLLQGSAGRGISVLCATVLAERAWAARLLRQIPGQHRAAYQGNVITVEVALDRSRPSPCTRVAEVAGL